ncbi:DUF3422 domain-containing protein [Ochrobactrum sp. POC9]|nr:DUF3422 family protein [Ochrobactrum sp. POC9]PWU70868.1 DUF3422 domain-containing protein [Ochrobactrum sp. POC9]
MRQVNFSYNFAKERAQALGEIHARPSALLASPSVVFQLAFMTENNRNADIELLSALARAQGVPAPDAHGNHFVMNWGQGQFRWERHTEFSTYFWDTPAAEHFGDDAPVQPFTGVLTAPGPLISGIRLEIRNEINEHILASFDPASLCRSEVRNGRAEILTDFRQNADGLTQIAVIDRDQLSDAGRGILVQRLLDIETYRTLAMLGLPLAQQLSPEMRNIEEQLTAITQRMKDHARDEADDMLSSVTTLAAELEANAASSLYRFGASRAYYDIVRERVHALGENNISGYETIGTFLERRLAPAMRTCQSVDERQANLSRKLARSTSLLRSWIDVELERLNANLLNSMDRRAQLQLRLQQTVEGLSVAAISYYVVGLVGYVLKSASSLGFHPLPPEVLTGLTVPLVVLGIWFLVRHIRNRHGCDEHLLSFEQGRRISSSPADK